MGHILLRDIYELSVIALPEYRGEILKDVMEVERWAGVIDGKWTNEQGERFVCQYELYMAKKEPDLLLEPTYDEALDPIIMDIVKRHSGSI